MDLPYRWVIVAAGGILGCVAIGAMVSLPVFLRPIAQDTGWSITGISTAMTLAPMVAANCAALKPTGPWPKTAMVSMPEMPRRFRAWKAVPVPQAQAAPSSKLRASGSATQVEAGTFKKS